MSYNIRCGFCEKEGDINHWKLRANRIEKVLEKYPSQIMGLQEAEEFQTKDLVGILNKNPANNFKYYGLGRELGEKGEASPIIWNSNLFETLEMKTIWLNETKEKFTKGWDAHYLRTLTIIKFKDKITNKEFYVFNTHLDNAGSIARLEASKLILEEKAKIGPAPLILMGDFNDIPNSAPHLSFISQLNDTGVRKTTDMTFNGFGKDETPGKIIDFIMVSKQVISNKFEIIYDKIDGKFPSDHYPVRTKVTIN